MSLILSTHADEKSTFVITASFTDEDGNAVTPDSVTWTLTKSDGSIVNSRKDVEETPDTSINIVLSGNDLALDEDETSDYVADGYSGLRILTVNAVYDSDYGLNLPLKQSIKFIIDNLIAVS